MAQVKATLSSLVKRAMLPALLTLLVLASAIEVVYVSHMNRRDFGKYQQLLAKRDELQTEWGQLLLEQNALAAYARVEHIATKRLNMRVPKGDDIIMVQQ